MRERSFAAIFAASMLVQILACKDAVAPPASSAAISVSVKFAGVYPLDAVDIQVDDRPMTLMRTDPSVVVRGLSSGKHTVSLVQLASQCESDGPSSTTVEASAANLSSVEFHVRCLASTGAIAISMSVTGNDRPLEMRAAVDSTPTTTIFVGRSATAVNEVLNGSYSAGVHVVTLAGIPQYCEPAGEWSTPVTVKTGAVARDTAVASFNIKCEPPELGADTAAAIAFERDGSVMLVNESGGNPVALTEGSEPAWSPDGKTIVFERLNCGTELFQCENDLWLTDPTGQTTHPAVADPYFDDTQAAISPNGASVAFIRFWPGPDQSYLAVSNLDGTSVKLLSMWYPFATPTWSPDATQIAFSCWGGLGSYNNICLVKTDKFCTTYFSNTCTWPVPVSLTSNGGDELDAAWSPDGRRIAFTLACAGGTALPPSQTPCPDGVTVGNPYVAVVDVTTRVVTSLVPGHDPSWSPDGARVVFVGNNGTGLRIYSFADKSVQRLTEDGNDRSPSWRQ